MRSAECVPQQAAGTYHIRLTPIDHNPKLAGPQKAAGVISAWRDLAAAGTEIWVGEIAASWHSGQEGWTDRFGDIFW